MFHTPEPFFDFYTLTMGQGLTVKCVFFLLCLMCFMKALDISGATLHTAEKHMKLDLNTTLCQMQLGNDQTSAIQLSTNQDIYIQGNKLATWQAIMLAFVPICVVCKGNAKCQAKYSSNS